ncbi:hypothetical protein T12_12959, partial [Trichinella patagoniensis]
MYCLPIDVPEESVGEYTQRLRHDLEELYEAGWLRAAAPEVLDRPESPLPCERTGRQGLLESCYTSPDEDQTWGLLQQSVRSPGRLEHVPGGEVREQKAT